MNLSRFIVSILIALNFQIYANTLPGISMDENLDPANVEEYCKSEPWILTPVHKANLSGKYGVIPDRFIELREKALANGELILASEYDKAAKKASRLYHKQMQKSFRYLQSTMTRKEIGRYAQSLWVNITMRVQKEEVPLGFFIPSEKVEYMSERLQELARKRVYMNTKWMALNINEIPL